MSELVDHEKVGAQMMSETTLYRRGGLLRREIGEKLGSSDESHAMPVQHGVMSEVLSDQRLSQAVGTDEHDVGGVLSAA